MRIEYMREFVAIHDEGNFSRAARSLFMTQPALSRHMQELERELGVRLIDRDRHSVSLTEIIDDYYGLFPERLDSTRGPILDMMQEGPLSNRSWKLLWPVAKERGISEQDARVINDMLVSYSRFLLEERLGESEGMLKSTELSEKLKTALSILI